MANATIRGSLSTSGAAFNVIGLKAPNVLNLADAEVVDIAGGERVTVVGDSMLAPHAPGATVAQELTPINRAGSTETVWVRSQFVHRDEWDPFFIVGLILTILG
jgi:hypothetical protein